MLLNVKYDKNDFKNFKIISKQAHMLFSLVHLEFEMLIPSITFKQSLKVYAFFNIRTVYFIYEQYFGNYYYYLELLLHYIFNCTKKKKEKAERQMYQVFQKFLQL